MQARKVVGVVPAAAKAERARLFQALEHAFAVRFEAREAGAWRGLDGVILFSSQPNVGDAPCPSLVFATGDARIVDAPLGIQFRSEADLDPRLRGQTLEEQSPRLGRLCPESGDRVLAAAADRPVWLRRHARDIVSAVPEELAETEVLRDRLRPGHFLGLLPLVHFLRQVEAELGLVGPPLRAAFIFDDPNLRAMSYGYLRYPDLVEHARQHTYHAVLATIPLDYAIVHPAAARLFREQAAFVSLTIHGNNHEHMELLRADSEPRAIPLVAQALRRTTAFEKRAQVPVARVMCAPHEACSEATLRALFGLGFEAASMARRASPVGRASPRWLLADWEPAQFVAGGFPILPRHSFGRSLDDVVLRAFLNQPLLLFGHQGDVAGGLEPLAQAAARINALGSVHWASLTDICRTNFAVRRDRSTLHVRLYARRVSVPIPEGVEELVVELPAAVWTDGPVHVVCGAASAPPVWPSQAEVTRVPFGGLFGATADIELRAARPLVAEQAPAPAWRVWPVLRRVLTEARDRASPLASRFARRGVSPAR